MMKKSLKALFVIISVFLISLVTGCSDHKKPEEGYISEDRLLEIVSNFEYSSTYTNYSVIGNFNYFNLDSMPSTISRTNVEFTDSPDVFANSCSSHFLRIPLHLTQTNWNSEAVDETNGRSIATRYVLESRIIRPASIDKVYYYETEGGGFIVKAFGANKELRIYRPSEITCNAKWNIEIEYDAKGYLVREFFETVNTKDNNKKDCCYGEANYTFR